MSENETPEGDEAPAQGDGSASTEPAKHSGGRPTLLTDEVMRVVEETLSVGLSLRVAALRAKVNRESLRRWFNQGEADDVAGVDSVHREFYGRIAGARGEFAYQATKWLWDNRGASSKGQSAENVRFVLERQYPEEFGVRKAVEMSGPDGGPVQVQTLDDLISKARGGGP